MSASNRSRETAPESFTTRFAGLALARSSSSMPGESSQHTLTGEFRTHARFRSRFLPHERTILVYLPPGYRPRAARRYPVLYLQDGQNVFDKATSIGEEWHVDETAQSLIESGQIEPLIVLAVYNTGQHRID